MAVPEHRRTIIHFDIDCFYAQVEMIRNPSLRDKPLGIQQKYLLVTCNYEARKRGVTKLMAISEAQKKCPDLIIVKGEDLTHYRNMSYQISDYIQKYTPLVERLGFDENFADVTDVIEHRIKQGNFEHKFSGTFYEFNEESSRQTEDVDSCDQSSICSCGCFLRIQIGSQIAADIREGLKHELGITCCAGIAHNKLLAKLVGSIHKPNQQTSILPHFGCQLVSSLPGIRSVPGIGSSSSKRLKARGIVSIWDLQQTPLSLLEEEFGKHLAETFSKLCFGVDDSPVVQFTLPQTISDEDSFKCCNKLDDAKSRIQQLVVSLLKRVKDDLRIPSTLRLTIRGKDYVRNSRQCPLPNNIFKEFGKENGCELTTSRLMPLLTNLFYKLVDVSKPFHLTLINVCFAKFLEQNSKQNTLDSFFRHQSSHTKSSNESQCYTYDKENKTDVYESNNNTNESKEPCDKNTFDCNMEKYYNAKTELEAKIKVQGGFDESTNAKPQKNDYEANYRENKNITSESLYVTSSCRKNSSNIETNLSSNDRNASTSSDENDLCASEALLISEAPLDSKSSPCHSEVNDESIEKLKKLLPKHIDVCEVLLLPDDIQNEVLLNFGVNVTISRDGEKIYNLISNKVLTRSQRQYNAELSKGNQGSVSVSHRKPLFSPRKRKAEDKGDDIMSGVSNANVRSFSFVGTRDSLHIMDKRQKYNNDWDNNGDNSNNNAFINYEKPDHFKSCEEKFHRENSIMNSCERNADSIMNSCERNADSLTLLSSPVKSSNELNRQINTISSSSSGIIISINKKAECDTELLHYMNNDNNICPSYKDLNITSSSTAQENLKLKLKSPCESLSNEALISGKKGETNTPASLTLSVTADNDNDDKLDSISQYPDSFAMNLEESHSNKMEEIAIDKPLISLASKKDFNGKSESAHFENREILNSQKVLNVEDQISADTSSATSSTKSANRNNDLISTNSTRGKCPQGIDEDVFNSLPSNIRGEILAHSAMGTTAFFTDNPHQKRSNDLDSNSSSSSPKCSLSGKSNSKQKRKSQKDIFDYFKKK